MERVFREVVDEWFTRPLPRYVPREVEYVLGDFALAVVGPRRAGKTYFLFQIADELVKGGAPRESVVYVNFEDVRLAGVRPEHFSAFVKTVFELAKPHGGVIYLLLDEVQNVPMWGGWVRTLLDSGRFRVALAGSSSQLDARAVSTELRGRYISRVVFPFSFREFLRARGAAPAHLYAPTARGALLALLREYVEWGGFPELVARPELRGELVRVYRDTVVLRDVVERHRISPAPVFEVFLSLVEEGFGRYFSISAAHRYLRGLGYRVSKKTLAAYLRYLEEAYYVLSARKLGGAREVHQQPRKIYPVDPAYFNLRKRLDIGARMEAVVAAELARRGLPLRYWRGEGHEVDFVAPGDPPTLIQVTYASAPDEVDRREVKALERAKTVFTGAKKVVVTWDYEETRGGVSYTPLWRWLLTAQMG